MEIDPQTLKRVWWQGAFSSALKGIPQGLALGALGFGMLAGGIYLFGATSLVASFGSFLFGNVAAATSAVTAGNIGAFIGTLSPVTFMALNTVLTVVGNFLTGGTIACNAYKQEVEHSQNETRIGQLEVQHNLHVAPALDQPAIASAPRISFAEAEMARRETPSAHQLH